MRNLSALLWTVASILSFQWLIGTVWQTSFSGLIHALLILIMAIVMMQTIGSRRTLNRRMTWVA